MAVHPKIVQIKRTQTPNNPPVGLLPGELSVEMNNPLRLWVGVPASIDALQRRLLLDATAGYVIKSGDTMTGTLAIKPAAVDAELILNKPTPAHTAKITGQLLDSNRWQVVLGTAESETGANAGTDFQLLAYDDGGLPLYPVLDFTRSTGLGTVKADPTDPLGIATKQYVDLIGGAGVLYVPQVKTAAERIIARQNIYAAPFDAMAYNGLHYNGGMEIAQEYLASNVIINGAAGAKTMLDGYTFQMSGTLTGTINAQQQAGGVLDNAAYFSKVLTLNCAATPMVALGVNEFLAVRIAVEGYRAARLGWGTAAGQPLTIGFWINPSAATTMAVSATNQAGDRGYPVDVPLSGALWQYKTVTIPPPPVGTPWVNDYSPSLYIWLTFGAGTNYQGANKVWKTTAGTITGTAATSNFFNAANRLVSITGFGAWPGSEAPRPEYSANAMRHHRDELQICQRYFCKSFPQATMPAANVGSLGAALCVPSVTSPGGGAVNVRFPVAMRVTPTINTLNPSVANNFWYDVNGATSRIVFSDPCDTSVRLVVNEITTLGSQHFIHWTARAQI